MANTFYTPSGNPASGSEGLSALIRGEFIAISAAFDMVPQITTTGLYTTIFAQTGNCTFTLPSAPGTLATTANVATETSRATAAEGALTAAVTAEAASRAAADTAEAAARVAADAAEVTARNTAIGVETSRATAAEALLAPQQSPSFTGNALFSLSSFVGVAQTISWNNGATGLVVTQGAGVNAGIGIALNITNTGSKQIQFATSGTVVGSITSSGSTTLYNTSSDYRLKVTFGAADGALIDAILVYDAEWRANPGERYPMFLAHELQAVAPWAVVGEKDALDQDGAIAPQMVDASKLIPAMIAKIQRLEQRIAAMEAKV